MVAVNEIYNEGPDAVSDLFLRSEEAAAMDQMDVKQLADICWTRATALARSSKPEARRWARAALAGYEFLSRHAKPLVAESAGETAEMLRAWKLLDENL